MATTEAEPDLQALVAELEDMPLSAKNGHQCQTAAVLAALPEDIRPAVEVLIDRKSVSAQQVSKVLAKYGYELRPAGLLRHRQRGTPNGCRCPLRIGATS